MHAAWCNPSTPFTPSRTLSTTGGNATRVLNDYIEENVFKCLFVVDSPFKTDLLDHYNCSHWVPYLCWCTITTKVSAVNSHNVIRNYKVNKVSGKYNHEGHESTLLFKGQETKHCIWFQLTETREKKLPFVELQYVFPCRLIDGKYSSTKHLRVRQQDSDWSVKCVTQYLIRENSQESVRTYFSISRCAANFIS